MTLCLHQALLSLALPPFSLSCYLFSRPIPYIPFLILFVYKPMSGTSIAASATLSSICLLTCSRCITAIPPHLPL